MQPASQPSNQTSSSQSSPKAQQALERLLSHMPPHIAATFSNAQLDAIQQALATSSWQRHPVDVRLSLPAFASRYYLVVLAGQERRSPERRRQAQRLHPVQAATIGLGVTTLGILGFFVLLTLSRFEPGREQQNVGPAAIPYISNQWTCEKSGRVWQDGECLDFSHNPMF